MNDIGGPHMSSIRFSFIIALVAMVVLSWAAVYIRANGSIIQPIGNANQVSINTGTIWRFEPSSASNLTTWVTSWSELTFNGSGYTDHDYTARWNNGVWTDRVEQTTGTLTGGGDLF